MSEAEILTAIGEVVQAHVQPGAVLTPETPLRTALELDSLKQLTLVTELENRFDLDLDDDLGDQLDTVADLVGYIGRHLRDR